MSGHRHTGESVTTTDGEHVGHICRDCLARVRLMPPRQWRDSTGQLLVTGPCAHMPPAWVPCNEQGVPMWAAFDWAAVLECAPPG